MSREAAGASGKNRKDRGSTKNEEHQWWNADRKDETHQRQHLMISVSYERSDPNNDNPYVLHYNLRKLTQ
jgi:hypothetical protein